MQFTTQMLHHNPPLNRTFGEMSLSLKLLELIGDEEDLQEDGNCTFRKIAAFKLNSSLKNSPIERKVVGQI